MKTLLLTLLLLSFTLSASAQEARRYAVLIGGLGGSPALTETYKQYLLQTHKALVDTYGFADEDMTVLAEPKAEDLGIVDGVSLADNIRAHFQSLASSVTEADQVYVILFGHGSYDGTSAKLNIPRRDLSDGDYAELLLPLTAGRLVFINTASASAPFIEALSGPNRIIITATKSGTQRNQTLFPQFLTEAFASPAADLDRDGDLSVREVFVYAAEATAKWYADDNHLATEHALLCDNGDGNGSRVDKLDEEGEGNLAAFTFLKRRAQALAAAGSEAAGQLRVKEEIERDIAALKSRKADLDVDEYYDRLEVLFVRLARLNDTLEMQR